MLTGSGGPRSSEEVYEAYQPSLDQFGKDSLTYIPSSPYCLEPSTRVLTRDLRWVPVGSLQVGDELVGFDEYQKGSGSGQSRTWQPATVTETSVITAPRYKMVMKSGKEIVSTDEHLWLTERVRGGGRGRGRGKRSKSYPQNWCWIPVKDIRPGDKIKSLGVDPWEVESTRDAGYLEGFYDGEGCLTADLGGTVSVCACQNRGPVQEKVFDLLSQRGFRFSDYGDEKLADWRLNGGRAETLRFLGTIRPTRLLNKFLEGDHFFGGRIYGGRKTDSQRQYDEVVSVEYLDEGPVVALGTSTNTLVAEGLLSHNTKVGRFYELYLAGSVLTRDYLAKHGLATEREIDEMDAAIDAEEGLTELVADPEMLVVQLPSWELYRDWEKGPSLVGVRFKRAIQYPPEGETVESQKMARLEKRNPEKFSVERRAQFASVLDGYLDEDKVDRIFQPFEGKVLQQTHDGILANSYECHIDPGRTNANFAMAIGHLEKSTLKDHSPECGASPDQNCVSPKCHFWSHVVIDYTRVWKPEDYSEHTIDYLEIERDLEEVIARFPSMSNFTSDQWNSASILAKLKEFVRKQKLGTAIREVTFTDKRNQEVAEKFKSAVNLGWVHAPLDDYFNSEGAGVVSCLLAQELKFLTEKSGKVVKQEIGPVTTKDLADCVMEVSVRLLETQLDNWTRLILEDSAPSFGFEGGYPKSGSEDVGGVLNGMRSGVDTERRVTSIREALNSYGRGGPASGLNDPTRGLRTRVMPRR